MLPQWNNDYIGKNLNKARLVPIPDSDSYDIVLSTEQFVNPGQYCIYFIFILLII